MNLAYKDVRQNFVRFLLTATGIGFLLTAAIGMIGVYRGIVQDALLVIDGIGADLWVVQGERSGPFAESSSIASDIDRRVAGLDGVATVRRFVQFSQQFQYKGQSRRASITGLDYPNDAGRWFSLTAGRYLETGHFEAVADAATGLPLGARVRLGKDDYTVVGTTRGMVDPSGDGMVFVTINDAASIATRRTSEQVLLARARNPRAAGGTSVSQDSKIAAILVTLTPGASAEVVRAKAMKWGDVNVITRDEQHDLLLNKRLARLRIQILAFTGVLLVVTAIVVSLIIYTLTIEKRNQIALLKLIGARDRVIVSMIAQQAALIGSAGYALALTIANLLFPLFPRRVSMMPGDLGTLFAFLALICAVASWIGIAQAMKVRAQEVLS
jgi:putative ABC transport system permease protein